MDKILRAGTRRRYYYELGVAGIRVIRNEGWHSFFRKAWHWLAHRGAAIKTRHNLPKSNTSIYVVVEAEGQTEFGGFISGRLEQIQLDDMVIILSQSGACKVLVRHGSIERDYVTATKSEDGRRATDFKVPAREFFNQVGHHTIELVRIPSGRSRDPVGMSRCELEYYGPCTVPFAHCDLNVSYDPTTGRLAIEGYYIGWRDPTLLLLSLPGGAVIPLEPTGADIAWLKNKEIRSSRQLTCRFSESCQLRIPPNRYSDEVILRARFGSKEEFTVARSHLVVTHDNGYTRKASIWSTSRRNPRDAVPEVSIIVLTHNALRYCRILFRSLRKTKGVGYEVVVVDNKSSLLTRLYLCWLFIRGRIHRLCLLNRNTLFAEGNNIGVNASSRDSKYILLLNSDIEIRDPLWLRKLIDVHLPGASAYGYCPEIWPCADGYCFLIDRNLYLRYQLDEGFPWWGAIRKLQAQLLSDGFSIRAVREHNHLIYHFWGKSGVPPLPANATTPSEQSVREWFGGKRITVIESI